VEIVLPFITAIVISMAVVPMAMRLAPRLGMVDKPDARKVHSAPIPRTGGIGIVLGALVPALLWVPLDPGLRSFVLGSLVLFVFGLLDDRRTLGPIPKFLGQIAAAALVVYYGDLYVQSLPFMGLEPLLESIGRPFTVFAIVGVINALNVADGLDGLAGGLSMMSLFAMAYLAFEANGGGDAMVALSACVAGGLLGFLRYNTHPARVFMGDSGSQFLGFTLGFMAVYLTQQVNPVLSPALPLLLLGLPIVDIFAAATQRVRAGISPFAASRHHIHHQLLELGLDHYETVVVIYSVQALLVTSAVFLRYQSDWAVAGVYFGICAALLLYVVAAFRRGWRAHRQRETRRLGQLIDQATESRWLTRFPATVAEAAIALLFVGVALMAGNVPIDFGIASAALAVILVVHLVSSSRVESLALRAIHYVTAAFVVYLLNRLPGAGTAPWVNMEMTLFVILAVAIAAAVRFDVQSDFRTTPTDYLIVFLVVAAGALSGSGLIEARHVAMVIKLVILFYGCELVLYRARRRWSLLGTSTFAALLLLGVRGLLAA
jgi:UDP-GlcNAc:undecaprenyl-phosphate GlcNAc-1-phosphate transferase